METGQLDRAQIAVETGQLDRAQKRLRSDYAPWAELRQLDEARRAIEAAAYREMGDDGLAEALLEPLGGGAAVATNRWLTTRVRQLIEGSSHVEDSRTVPLHTLTEREREVLRLLVRGARRHEIAAELYVSVNTVKTQVRSLYRKLGVANRGEAIRAAQFWDLAP